MFPGVLCETVNVYIWERSDTGKPRFGLTDDEGSSPNDSFITGNQLNRYNKNALWGRFVVWKLINESANLPVPSLRSGCLDNMRRPVTT